MVLKLKPRRGGFLRLFSLGWFIKEFLLANAPYGSPAINPSTGAPQADIFSNYKKALIRETAMDRAVRAEDRTAYPDAIILLALYPIHDHKLLVVH